MKENKNIKKGEKTKKKDIDRPHRSVIPKEYILWQQVYPHSVIIYTKLTFLLIPHVKEMFRTTRMIPINPIGR